MKRNGLVLAGVFVAGIGLSAALALRSSKDAEPGLSNALPPPVTKIGPRGFDTLEVTKSSVTTVLRRDGDRFLIVKPVSYVAEKNGALLAFEAIENMEWVERLSEETRLRPMGDVALDSLRVVAKKDDRILLDMQVGKTKHLRTMVRLESDDRVWLVTNLMRYMLNKDTNGWRDKTLTTFDEAGVAALVVTAQDGAHIALARSRGVAGPSGKWLVTESTVTVDPLDEGTVVEMLSRLKDWKANDFADDAKPEGAGLAPPRLTIAITLADGRHLTAFIGNKKGEEDTYVRTADSPQIYLVKTWGIEPVNKQPIDFFCRSTTHDARVRCRPSRK